MNNKTISRALLVSFIFVLFSLFPIIQLLFVTYNGGILYVVEKYILKSESQIALANFIVNFSLSLLFIILYYKSKTKISESIYSILFLIFSLCFIFFQAYTIKIREIEPWFLLSLIESIISGIILLFFAVLKFNYQRASGQQRI